MVFSFARSWHYLVSLNLSSFFFFFFFNDTATTEIYTFPYTTLFRSPCQPEPVCRDFRPGPPQHLSLSVQSASDLLGQGSSPKMHPHHTRCPQRLDEIGNSPGKR